MSISSRLLINFPALHYHHHRCLTFGRTLLATNASAANNDNKASPDQLTALENKLANELPRFFVRPHNYSLYTKDLVFIDNTRNVRTEGITQYILRTQMIKIYYGLRYTSIRVELLNLVKNPEESYLRIRWRIITKPGMFKTLILLFSTKKADNWKDGISTMHVNKDGKIYCHVCDNIDVDTDDIEAKAKEVKDPLVSRGLSVCNKHRV